MSLTFGGATTDRVVMPAVAAQDSLTAWTWYGWVYPTTITAGRHFFAKTDPGGSFGGRSARILTGGFIRANVTRAGGEAQYVASSGAVTTNSWQFVAVTYDEAAAAGEVFNIYVGSLSALATETTYSTTTNGSGATVTDAAVALKLGNNDAHGAAFQGRMGPCAHFNRAMTLAEIQSHQFDPRNAPGCVGLWNLGDNGTSTQTDYSGNASGGTVTGATQGDNPPLRRRWGRQLLMPTSRIIAPPAGGTSPYYYLRRRGR